MPIGPVVICCVLGAVLLVVGLMLLAWVRTVKRWKRTMEVRDDTRYVETLATLSANTVRHPFNPYTDIDWDAPEFRVTQNDPRWVLSATDPLAVAALAVGAVPDMGRPTAEHILLRGAGG
jgi:hypothetical protein